MDDVLPYAVQAAFGPSDALILAFLFLLFAAPFIWSWIARRWKEWAAARLGLRIDAYDPTDAALNPRPPSKLVISATVVGAYLIALIITWTISFGVSGPPPHPNDQDATLGYQEVLMLGVIIVWASLPLARSTRDLVFKAAFFAVPLFAILALLLYQTPFAFWITATVLVVIVIRELGQRFDTEPPLTKIAQAVMVFAFFISWLLAFTIYFLPNLAATLYAQFDYLTLFRLRAIAGTVFGVIVLLGTVAKTLETFRFQYRDVMRRPQPYANPGDSLWWSAIYPFALSGLLLATAFTYIVNLGSNFFRLVGTFFATVAVEAWRFVWHAFLSRALWQTVFYIAATAICLFVLAADVLLVKPYLFLVVRSPTLLLDPANIDLAWANAYLALAFGAAMLAIFALAQIWLPRSAPAEIRQLAVSRVVIAAGAIYICACLATVTYFPILNSIFDLHSPDLNWPGVFTSFALVLATIFAVTVSRSRDPA